MDLLTSDYELFDRSMYTFKQLKESYTTEELVQLKVRYQTHWQKWKKMNEQVAKATPLQWQMRKPKSKVGRMVGISEAIFGVRTVVKDANRKMLV